MLNVQRLILLRELDSRGSLAAVARAHEISPAAVSQQLALLEREVGIPLTERVGRRTLLTPMGKKLARRADQVVGILESAEADVDAALSDVHGTVRLASFGSFAVSYFAEILHRMKASYPQVTVEFALQEPTAAISSLVGRRISNLLAIASRKPNNTSSQLHSPLNSASFIIKYLAQLS